MIGFSVQVNVIVVYKVDRLTRSLADFAKLVETFDDHEVSFVSVTQSFNTTSSMGRLTLNVLLSFAQFEREWQISSATPRNWALLSLLKPSETHSIQTFATGSLMRITFCGAMA